MASTYDGADEFEWSARVIRGDGEERWCRGLGRVERGPDGTPLRMNGTDQDITDQVMADHEIGEYTRRLALLRQVAEAANRSTSLVEALVTTVMAPRDHAYIVELARKVLIGIHMLVAFGHRMPQAVNAHRAQREVGRAHLGFRAEKLQHGDRCGVLFAARGTTQRC